MSNNSVYIVAGGSSLKGFDFLKLKDKNVIAINKSIIDVPFAKHFITMDYTFIDHIESKTNNKLNRKKFFQYDCEKYFIVATNNKYLQYINNQYIDTRYNYPYDLSGFDYIISSHDDFGLGRAFDAFVHGCNSGFCGLQLGLLLNYKKIYLLGYDLKADDCTHYHEGYHQSLRQFKSQLKMYSGYFLNGVLLISKFFPDVKVYNCSEISKLNELLPYYSLEDIS